MWTGLGRLIEDAHTSVSVILNVGQMHCMAGRFDLSSHLAARRGQRDVVQLHRVEGDLVGGLVSSVSQGIGAYSSTRSISGHMK